jgi:hypothetical protein
MKAPIGYRIAGCRDSVKGDIIKVEYKSPDDHVSVEDFYKVYGYACLYASLNRIPVTEITISFVTSRYPRKLLEHLKEVRGYRVEEQWPGIYRIAGDIIPIQIIDNRRLPVEENLWLKGLGKDLEIGPALAILKKSRELINKIPLGAYLHVLLNENAKVFLEVGKMENGSLTFDDVLMELGLTDRWKEEGREEVAKNALVKGLPLDTIEAITGFDIETIKTFAGK